MNRTLTLVIAVLAALTPVAGQAADAVNGKKLFMSVGCYACHGRVGQGAAPTGPRLAPAPLPVAAFLKELRSPRNVMPPYAANLLPDAAVEDIRAYLATIPAPDIRPR